MKPADTRHAKPADVIVDAPSTRRRMTAFYATAGLTVALLILGLFQPLTFIVTAWLPDAMLEDLYGDVTSAIVTHRMHLFGVSLVAWLALAAMTIQLRRPTTKIALGVFALATFATVTLVDLISGLVDPVDFVLLALGTIVIRLHPGRSATTFLPVHPVPLIAAAVGGIGWLTFAVIEMTHQLTWPIANEHVDLHHFGVMAALAMVIAFSALIGATSPAGRHIVAAMSACTASFYGLASTVFPDYESSLGVPLGIGAIAWAATYVWTVRSWPNSPITTPTRKAGTETL